MYQSVKNVFSSFSGKFEGRVHWMYVDVKGLVTTGVGNLIDPVSMAVGLPFQHSASGAAATQAQITAAWTDLKNNSVTLGQQGYQACASRNDLRLTDPAIDNLVTAKLASNETTFLRSFPDFQSWPADAQLAGMSMCWALGPAFASQWPQLSAALRAHNWASAAANCSISTTGNAGVVPRNTADQALFNNAAAVVKNGADPSVVYYPGTVPASPAAGSGAGSGTSGSGTSTTGSGQGGASGSTSPGTSGFGGKTSQSGSASPTGSGSTGTDSDSTATDSDGTDSTGTDTDTDTDTDGSSTDGSGTDDGGTDSGTSGADGDGSATDSGSADGTGTDGGGTDAGSGDASGDGSDSGAGSDGGADGGSADADSGADSGSADGGGTDAGSDDASDGGDGGSDGSADASGDSSDGGDSSGDGGSGDDSDSGS